MVQILTVGIAAGAAAALLVASVISGSSLAILLVSIAPLPILIAATGWSHWAGLLAAAVGATALAAALTSLLFVPFLVGVGLPAWWLGYLALLARPGVAAARAVPAGPTVPAPSTAASGNVAAADGLEWYPIGRLVVWAAVLATAVVALSLIKIGLDADSIRAGLKRSLEQVLRLQMRTPTDAPLELPGLPEPKGMLDLFALIFPPAAAVLATITNLINLWLAARVVKISGRLRRPWPDLASISFPPGATLLLAAAIGGSFLPGLIGILAGVLMATLLTAYAALGFAVLHKITGGMLGRGFVLTAAYTAVGILIWPVLAMTLLGLADTLLDVRGRIAAWRGPSTPDT